LTYWVVETPPATPIKIFVHLLGESDVPLAQHDGLGSPSHGWAAGDLIVQKHVIPLPADLYSIKSEAPPSGQCRLQIGLYDPATEARLAVLTADRLLLHLVEVVE
jgi:hypothetical protein